MRNQTQLYIEITWLLLDVMRLVLMNEARNSSSLETYRKILSIVRILMLANYEICNKPWVPYIGILIAQPCISLVLLGFPPYFPP